MALIKCVSLNFFLSTIFYKVLLEIVTYKLYRCMGYCVRFEPVYTLPDDHIRVFSIPSSQVKLLLPLRIFLSPCFDMNIASLMGIVMLLCIEQQSLFLLTSCDIFPLTKSFLISSTMPPSQSLVIIIYSVLLCN